MPNIVQSILFSRRLYTESAAEKWLDDNGFVRPKVDITPNYLRYRQVDPEGLTNFVTKQIAHGIMFIFASVRNSVAKRRQDERIGGGIPDRKRSSTNLLPGNRETSDEELSNYCKKHIGDPFAGVVSRSELTKIYPKNESLRPGTGCIINLDPNYRNGGTHWTGMWVHSQQPLVLYFDSYGMPPPREVTNRARHDGMGIVYSDIQYQNLGEKSCGPRSVAFLKLMMNAAKKGDETDEFGRLAKVL